MMKREREPESQPDVLVLSDYDRKFLHDLAITIPDEREEENIGNKSLTLDQLAQHLIKALEKLPPEERENLGKQVDQELAKGGK